MSTAVSMLSCTACNPYSVQIDAAPWIRALGSDDMHESDAADDSIVGLGPAAVPLLETALDREPAPVRIGAVEALARLNDPRGIAILARTALHDPDVDVRYEALRSLPASNDAAVREAVEGSLADPDVRIRRMASQLCAAACASPEAFDRLIEIAAADPHPANAWAARRSLAIILAGKRTDVDSLRARIRDSARAKLAGGGARLGPALLLAQVHDASAVPILIEEATASAYQAGRIQAVYALGESGDERAVAPLDGLLDATPPIVGMYAYQALATLAKNGSASAAAAIKGYRGTPPKLPLPPPGP